MNTNEGPWELEELGAATIGQKKRLCKPLGGIKTGVRAQKSAV